MGAVYRAEDLRLGRHVALKLLPAARARDAQARARFQSEARAVSALEHPHICLLYEFDEAEGQLFLAMQLVDGETLKQALQRGPLPEPRTRDIVTAVASALAAAHVRGIIHRDVKSENILLGRDGAIKLTDFGVARLAEVAGLTSASTVIGTPSYLAPEQVTGLRITPAADQFSLAVVAYECLTGALPFVADTVAAVFHAVLNLEPAPPSRQRAGIAPAWDGVLQRALAKTPEHRFESVEAFARAVAATAWPAPAAGATPGGGEDRVATTAGTAAPSGGAGVRAAPAPATAIRSLAVLYFENLSRDPESDYFCAGITEDILTDLSKIPDLRVASRNAVSRYRGQSVEVSRVAAELGVGAVLEGGVRRSGDRVRITAQLVNAYDGFQLWAERYDRTLEDVFAVQEGIAHAIATALRGALTPAEVAEIRRGRPREVEAYDLYLRGRELYRRYTPADNRRALELFEQAVQVDPHYALAWSGIADCCAQVSDKQWDRDPGWQERGFAAARRAIDLDPRLAEGHKAEALLWHTRRDPERATAALGRALEADPRFIPALINLGHEQLSAGDFAGAERTFRRAVEVDPAYGFGHLMLALVLHYTRRYAAAIEASHRAQNAGASPFYTTYCYPLRAHAWVELGRFEAAEHELTGGRAAGAPAPILKAAEALIAARLGRGVRARSLLGELEAGLPGESYGCELAAAAAGVLGEAAQAARLLQAAERIDQRHWAYWRVSPDLAPVRESAEFTACLGKRGRRMVWPSEAPPLDPRERAQYADYGEASGLPEGIAP